MSFTYAEEANTKTVQGVLDAFKTADGLTVEPLGFAWGDMQKNIFLRARSKSLPDIAQLSERWLPTFASLDTLVDLNTVYGKEKLEAAFAPDALAMGNIDGKQYALPLISGTIGMVANKEVLEKAGVSKAPETRRRNSRMRWSLSATRFRTPCLIPWQRRTTARFSSTSCCGTGCMAAGSSTMRARWSSTAMKRRDALQFMVDLVKDRLAAPEIDRPDSRRLMAQGASAFYLDAPQTRTFLRDFSGKGVDFDKNVLPMTTPVLKAGRQAGFGSMGAPPRAICAGRHRCIRCSGRQVPCLLTSDVVQTDYPLKMSALPVTKSAREAVSGDAYLAAWSKATGDARRNEVGIWSNAAELTQIVGEEAQAAMLGQKSADDAIKTMQG
jgi:multiple sugar transport system substrate-binding protein